jgi:signal-transduction protein with cAMP-binding, CBS, and nucleotidyltransferase domain
MIEIIYNLKQTYFSDESIIVKKGDVTNSIFFVISGKVSVMLGRHVIEKLGKNSSFGAYKAIIKGNPKSNFDFIAYKALVLELPGSVLAEKRQQFPSLDASIQQVEAYIQVHERPFCDFFMYYDKAQYRQDLLPPTSPHKS